MIEAYAPRTDFPVLSRDVHPDVPLVYLDSAASSQKPLAVLDAMANFDHQHYAAINRGSHVLAAEATTAVEQSRQQLADFLGVVPESLSWTKNSTEALNAIAYTFFNETVAARLNGKPSRFALEPGTNIVVTRAEHHANLVPWQEVCRKLDIELRWLDLTATGELDLETAEVIDEKTRVVAFTHVSNVTGAISPVEQLVARGRAYGAYVVLDACQSVPHIPVNFAQLDVDFAVLSGHKMLGPSGIGALYVKPEVAADMPPFLTGGSMVEVVTMERTTFAAPPQRFEAGTQPVTQIVGLGAAAQYLSQLGMAEVAAHEQQLTDYALREMAQLPGIRILGSTEPHQRVGVIAFAVDGVHPHDVGQLLDARGVALRVGHHCAQPVHQHFGVFSSSRISFAPYNTSGDVDAFLDGLAQVRKYFGVEG